MYHKIELIGRLGKDPEMRYTPDGKAVVNFDLAIDIGKDKTMWVRIVTWEALAENCNKFLNKGSLVHVEGTLIPDNIGNPKVFKRKDNSYGSVYEVLARRVTFLSPKVNESDYSSREDYADLF